MNGQVHCINLAIVESVERFTVKSVTNICRKTRPEIKEDRVSEHFKWLSGRKRNNGKFFNDGAGAIELVRPDSSEFWHLTAAGRELWDAATQVPANETPEFDGAFLKSIEDEAEIKRREQRGEISSTTAVALVNARRGQGAFRCEVLGRWENRCAVTGSGTQAAIRASHIKPWRDSTDQERLDPHNGLPLIANLDALFDAGLISFESSGRMIVAPRLSASERRVLGVIEGSLAKKPAAKTAEYLGEHRNTHRNKLFNS
ncbi:MAG: HNH endonuclease signature motif containing protein [Planctomycetales bacterium]